MSGLFTCRICGADSPYDVCDRCVPPTIRARRYVQKRREQGLKDVYTSPYEFRHGKRPPPQRDETPLPEED
jgi:hypothetical protein